MTSEDARLPIEEIADDGEQLEPKQNRSKFISQAGAIVRDILPITIPEWNKPAAANDDDPCYVHQVTKDLLWDTLLTHFNLPQNLTKIKKEKCKQWTLSKMATQFRNWKKTLWKKYENKDPDFSGTLEKIQNDWPAFVAYKKSSKAVTRSATNKLNAAKKIYHHRLGAGGYRTAIPKWLAFEAELLAKGIRPQTYDWPERSKFWLFAHGAGLDPQTGQIVAKGRWKKKVETITKKLIVAIDEVRRGVFQPDRENDELTRALGNPEHVGRARGHPGGVTFKNAWPECADSYRSRSRNKKKESERLSELERVVKRQQEQLDAISQQRAAQQQLEDPPADAAPSQRRSSVGST